MSQDDSILKAEPTAESAQSILRELSVSTTSTCGVIRGGAPAELVSASKELCAKHIGQICDLHFFEGHEAESGESVADQFERQLGKCLGNEAEWYSLAIKFVHNLLAMYPRNAIAGSEKNLYYLRVQVNVPEACVKHHDDHVGIRAVTALCGESTVVIPAPHTNWEHWDKTGGRLPLPEFDINGDDDEEDEVEYDREETNKLIQDFNATMCSPENEFQAPTGDVLLLKGAKLTQRPCIHRAPYSADLYIDEEAEKMPEAQRMLVTLDYIPPRDLERFIVLYAEDDDEDYEDEDC